MPDRRRIGRDDQGMSPRTPTAVDAIVGRNVRLHRMAKGLTQTVLGDRLGLSFQQVQKYENGVNRIGSGRLVRIARALDVPLAALLDGADGGERSPAPSALHLIAARRPFRLARAFAAIDEPGLRRSLVALVELTARVCAGRRGGRARGLGE
ncbi:MAG TPA: helix-turn-helix transcriptional regulator [Xanthobacteraceae bacterium]|nr:helix-turn-helix transcriptional regulator [Xanthobacteraceae bacterium]